MDKSKWTQKMKDQFNEEIRKRALHKFRTDKMRDEWLSPQIWKMPLTEANVFGMLAYTFPFNHVILKILQRFYKKMGAKKLLLSSRYLFESHKIFPGYYSDRERIVVMLNRYRSNGNIEEFVKWLPFNQDQSFSHLIHLMIGVFFLDQYLSQLNNQKLLTIAISHMEKGKGKFKSVEAHLAFSSLIAFGHYMNKEFENSMEYLDHQDTDELQDKFGSLLKKVA